MQPTKEDLVLLGKMKQEDLNYEIANYDYECGLTSIDRDYAKRHGLTLGNVIRRPIGNLVEYHKENLI